MKKKKSYKPKYQSGGTHNKSTKFSPTEDYLNLPWPTAYQLHSGIDKSVQDPSYIQNFVEQGFDKELTPLQRSQLIRSAIAAQPPKQTKFDADPVNFTDNMLLFSTDKIVSDSLDKYMEDPSGMLNYVNRTVKPKFNKGGPFGTPLIDGTQFNPNYKAVSSAGRGPFTVGQAQAVGGLASGLVNTVAGDTVGGAGLSGAFSGMAAGASLGPLGMVGGAVVGGLTSAFGANAQKKAEEEMLANQRFERQGNTLDSVNTMANPNIPTFKYGGNAEIEGGEVVQDPSGALVSFDGPSHEQGGIDVNLKSGARIFSKELKGNDKITFADKADGVRIKMKHFAKIADDVRGTKLGKFTANLMLKKLNKQLDSLFQEQETMKYQLGVQNQPNSYELGGEFDESTGGERPTAYTNIPIEKLLDRKDGDYIVEKMTTSSGRVIYALSNKKGAYNNNGKWVTNRPVKLLVTEDLYNTMKQINPSAAIDRGKVGNFAYAPASWANSDSDWVNRSVNRPNNVSANEWQETIKDLTTPTQSSREEPLQPTPNIESSVQTSNKTTIQKPGSKGTTTLEAKGSSPINPNFVIFGSYDDMSGAKRGEDELRAKGYDAKAIKHGDRNWVTLGGTYPDRNSATAARDEYLKDPNLKYKGQTPWVPGGIGVPDVNLPTDIDVPGYERNIPNKLALNNQSQQQNINQPNIANTAVNPNVNNDVNRIINPLLQQDNNQQTPSKVTSPYGVQQPQSGINPMAVADQQQQPQRPVTPDGLEGLRKDADMSNAMLGYDYNIPEFNRRSPNKIGQPSPGMQYGNRPYSYGDLGTDLLEYSPTIYNLINSFGANKRAKQIDKEYDPNKYLYRSFVEPRRTNLDPIRRELEAHERSTNRELRNLGSDTSGGLYNRMMANSGMTRRSLSNVAMQEEDKYNEGKLRADMFNAQVGMQNKQMLFNADQQRRAAHFANRRFLPEALTGASKIVGQRRLERNQMNMDMLRYGTLPNYSPSFNPYQQGMPLLKQGESATMNNPFYGGYTNSFWNTPLFDKKTKKK